jgi:hypothetical protein
MLESQREQEERRRTLQNDVRVREQTGTFMSHTHDDIHQGRFAAIGPAVIVGSTEFPNYPAAAAHQRDPVPDEPPLSPYENDAFEPSTSSAGCIGDADVPPSPALSPCLDVEPASPPSSSGDPAPAHFPPGPARNRVAGSPVPYRRY